MAVFMSGGAPVTWSNSYTTSVDAAGGQLGTVVLPAHAGMVPGTCRNPRPSRSSPRTRGWSPLEPRPPLAGTLLPPAEAPARLPHT